MIYDIGFIYRQFISENGTMPSTYPEFVKAWRKNFTSPIFDTKVLAAYCG
jgi:CAF1 family ribonuclease